MGVCARDFLGGYLGEDRSFFTTVRTCALITECEKGINAWSV